MKYAVLSILIAPLFAATIPAGTEIDIRLTDKVASEAAAPRTNIHAVVIAPVLVDGKILLPAGPTLTGTVKAAKAAGDKVRSQLQVVFTEISDGKVKAPFQAVVSRLDNARETVDDKGVILGIDASLAYGNRLNQGITALEGNEKLSALAAILQGAKQTLKIQEVNANIDYDAGVELAVKLTAPLNWTGTTTGPESKLLPFPNESDLPALVTRQPFRTMAAKPARPSDMTNLMFIGTEAELHAAFEKAGWYPSASLSSASKLETARALIEDRGYKEGPMSVLLLDNQPPVMALQKGNNTYAQRHHLRIFRRPDTFAGKPVWVCSSTHDTGIDFSERDRTFIHKVDGEIDKERAKVVSDLLFTGLVKSVALVARPDVPQTIENATGDSLKTDGAMAVLLF
jgi:hypothetical protein